MILGTFAACDSTEKETDAPEEEGLFESTAGLRFKLNSDGKGYTLVGTGTCTATEIVIDGYNGFPVTSIGIMRSLIAVAL